MLGAGAGGAGGDVVGGDGVGGGGLRSWPSHWPTCPLGDGGDLSGVGGGDGGGRGGSGGGTSAVQCSMFDGHGCLSFTFGGEQYQPTVKSSCWQYSPSDAVAPFRYAPQ